MAKVTAVGDVIVTVVATVGAATSYPVFDGPFTKRPSRIAPSYICIGAEEPYNDENANPINSGSMSQVWKGLGQKSRDETLQIPCVAVGIAVKGTVAQARATALAVVQDVFDNLNALKNSPTNETYGALVDGITSVESRNMSGGAEVTVKFTISASARLV
jgi:hypothetical protein